MRSFSRLRWRRWFAVAGLMVAAAMLLLMVGLRGFDARDWPRLVLWTWSMRRVNSVAPHDDVRWIDLQNLDLQASPDLIPTLGFNRRTRWPKADHLPFGASPEVVLSQGMNPGLGVRELHRQGITGRGISVGIIDFNVVGQHPEYADRLVAVHRSPGVNPRHGSMHGPAVVSLLAGRNCGTAPEASVYLFVTSEGSADAAEHAAGLEWFLELNRQLPAERRIRVVSISSAPSGRAQYPFKNSARYDEVYDRASRENLLVIDGTEHHGWVGPCTLAVAAREDPQQCQPVLARGQPDYFSGRLLCPTSPRTTAEEYGPGLTGYQHCGLQVETRRAAGSSWSMPYAAGVAALGWQVRHDLTAAQMKAALLETASRLPSGERIIQPSALISQLAR